MMMMSPSVLLAATVLLAFSLTLAFAQDVTVDVIKKGSGPPVTTAHRYSSHVTLYIKNDDGSKTPSGWSTRKSDGAATDQPFAFQPGVGLIIGWTEGVLKMTEGERSWLTVPSEKGYGAQSMGSPGGSGFYIPANSNLLFDIEILGKESDMMSRQDL
jgi:FKBP-type peptidyl-prolyl cis-trans isomerase